MAYLDWGGGDDDLLVLLHANGLCAGVYDPLARRLAGSRRVVGIDLCGHGSSDAPSSEADLGFDSMADDVIAVLDRVGADRAALVGVSLGGGVGIEATLRSGGRIDRLMLCEAIAFASMRRADEGPNPMADGARRRRRTFADRAEARSRYAGRGVFAELEPGCLDGYLRWGLRDVAGGVELACDPETEATLFSPSPDRYGGGHAFDRIVELTSKTSVLAGTGTYLERDWFVQQAAAARTSLELIDGGHFFLFTDVERGVELIETRIGGTP